jgi:hypothetical protein
MIELPPERLDVLRPLFAGCPYLHGLVHGVFTGAFGQVFADDEVAAQAGMLCVIDFVFFAGDVRHVPAEAMIQHCAPGSTLIPLDAAWRQRLREVWGERLKHKQRFAFRQPARWDRVRLRSFMSTLPPGYALKQITAEDAPRFASLDGFMVGFDNESLAHNVGFGVEYEGRFVSGASGSVAGGMLDFEVQTQRSHVRQGLATAASAALIDHCLDHNVEPCWDAANEMSARLATKLGFVGTTPYDVYDLV